MKSENKFASMAPTKWWPSPLAHSIIASPVPNFRLATREWLGQHIAVKLIRVLLGLLLVGALWPVGAARGADAAALEFRGVMQTGKDVKVGLFDRSTGLTVWVKVPAQSASPSAKISAGIAVREYNPAHNRLSVDYQGKTYTLVLQEAVLLYAPPPPPSDDGAAGPTDPDNIATGGGETTRRRALTQVETVNHALLAAGVDESQLLPGNPEPDSPTADAAPVDSTATP